MSRPILAPLVVALSAFLVASQIPAEPTAPLFVVEQQRSALVTRLAKQWSDAFAVLPRERRLDHEQLSSALFALRADRLFAVTLAGDVDAVESVLSDAKRDAVKPRVSTKSLGDATADLTYTPINPCRILDTRSTVAGPLAPNVARTFDGYSTNFATQGGTGSGCGIPNGVAALAMNVYAVNPTNLGFIKVWRADGTEPDVSTVNYQVGITAIATGTLVPVDQVNSNRFNAKSPATVDFIADVVGFFKPPGDATSLDIKVAGQRMMRYEYNAISPNVIGGSPANSVAAGVRGGTISGGGIPVGIDDPNVNIYDEKPNRVTGLYGTVAGGMGNVAGDDQGYREFAYFATVSGGRDNLAKGGYATVGGGLGNIASEEGSTVAGGRYNRATLYGGVVAGGSLNAALSPFSSIVGGSQNSAEGVISFIGGGELNAASGNYSAIAGGTYNLASGARSFLGGGGNNRVGGEYAAIAGGWDNWADGEASFSAGSRNRVTAAGRGSVAMGQDATAEAPGCFVFGDDSSALGYSRVTCTATNQAKFRVLGGVWFFTGGTSDATYTGAHLAPGSGSWTVWSDGETKNDFVPVASREVLEKVVVLPIGTWNWKAQDPAIRHMGPTAQDFHAAFGLGETDKGISTVDAQGVAFAAIQGLNAKFDSAIAERDARIVKQDQEIAELKRAVEILLTRTSPEGRVTEGR